MSKVYVRDDVRAVVFNTHTLTHVPLRGGVSFDTDDPFVNDIRWALETDVEQATAAPGEKRNVRRSKSDA